MTRVIQRINMLKDDDDPILPVPVDVPFWQDGSQSTLNQSVTSVVKKRRRSTKLLKWSKTNDSSQDETCEDTGQIEVSAIAKKCKIVVNEKTDSYAWKRAEEIRAGLSAEHPSFSKLMLHSHVGRGFWLGLSKKFTDENLPKYDCEIILVDEEGKECRTKYLFQKTGLSAGWREFAITHALSVGDVCIFHLIKQTTLLFKVYIVREKMCQVVGALNKGAFQQQSTSDQAERITNSKRSPLLLEENTQPCSDAGSGCEVVDGLLRLSDTSISFKGMKEFDKFSIIVDDLVMDSFFTVDIRMKYHKLCCSQGALLHEKLRKGLNINFVLWIITEVVNIADAIEACGEVCASYEEDLCLWEKTLKVFTLLGMNVSFLCERLSDLMGVASEPDVTNDSRFKEMMVKQVQEADLFRALEIEFRKAKETKNKFDSMLKAVIQASARKQQGIKEIANAPW